MEECKILNRYAIHGSHRKVLYRCFFHAFGVIERIVPVFLILLLCNHSYASESKEINFDLDKLSITSETHNGVPYSRLIWDGMLFDGVEGSVETPTKYVRLLVPTYCKVKSVLVADTTVTKRISLEGIPYPVQKSNPSDGSENISFTEPNLDLYSTLPNVADVSVVGEDFVDGCNHVVIVRVSPISFRQTADGGYYLELYDNITIELTTESCSLDEMDVKPLVPKYSSPYINLSSVVDNPGRVGRYSTGNIVMPDSARYYVIISPENLVDSFKELTVWKRQKGYNVVLKSYEEILSDKDYQNGDIVSNINDDAGKVRTYLRDFYLEHGQFFLLLVGDWHCDVPIRYYQGTIPTDLYFSDLVGNWDPNNDGVYGDSLSYKQLFPTIYVGRLLVSSALEIENFTRKLETYESNPGSGDYDYLLKSLYFECDDMVKAGESIMVSSAFGDTFSVVNSFQEKTDVHPKGSDIINELNNTYYGFVSMHGHGNPGSILTSQVNESYGVISNNDLDYSMVWVSNKDVGNGIDLLKNYNYPFVAYSIACTVNPFDKYSYIDSSAGYHMYDIDKNIGASMTTGGKYGAVAFLGNTREGYVRSSACMESYFAKEILYNNKIGIAEGLSKYDYRSPLLSATHTLIGDPEMEMWTKSPDKLKYDIGFDESGSNLSNVNDFDGKISIYDGADAVSNYYVDESVTTCRLDGFKNGVLSMWQTNRIPIIDLYLRDGEFSNTDRNFIVKRAFLGDSSDSSKVFSTKENVSMVINAVESVTINPGFVMDSGSECHIICDGDVSIYGGTIKSGAKLIIEALNTEIKTSFSVQKGGELIIKKN